MIQIKKCNKPNNISMVEFNVDGELDKKLNKFELTKQMNKHNFTLFLGKAGQGKTSLCISLLKTKSLFKNIYHDILLFVPPNSRQSIKNDFWGNNIPQDEIYDDLTIENLENAYSIAENNAQENFKTLIIIDDLQKNLKDIEVQKFLLHMVNNRRHSQLSIWLLCQNYIQISLQIRMAITHAFIFNVSKKENENIFNELIEIPKETYQNILNISYKNKHDFLFIVCGDIKKIFYNWDEILIT